MSWYRISLTEDEITTDKEDRIMETFHMLLLHQPKNERGQLALFSGGWSRHGEHDVTSLYFSPKCADIPAIKGLIDSYNGIPCSEPTRETEKEMGLLVGIQDYWEHMVWHPDL
jgi:hypothetical protein